MSMLDEMEWLEQKNLLETLNEKKLPFYEIQIMKDGKGDFKKLGKGGNGTVYECIDEQGNSHALKIIGFEDKITNDERDNYYMEQLVQEVQIQIPLSSGCENIVRIEKHGILVVEFDEEDNILDVNLYENWSGESKAEFRMFLCILMEKLEPVVKRKGNTLVPLESLYFFGQNNEECYNEVAILKFALDIGRALRTIHRLKTANRDIKPSNIYWDEKKKIYKLGDFGTAKVMLRGTELTMGRGTQGYMAPEVMFGVEYDVVKADVYSFGITLYQFLNDLRPLPPLDILYRKDRVLPKPCRGSERLISIVMKACEYRAEDRYATMGDMCFELESMAVYLSVLKMTASQQQELKKVLKNKDAERSALVKMYKMAFDELEREHRDNSLYIGTEVVSTDDNNLEEGSEVPLFMPSAKDRRVTRLEENVRAQHIEVSDDFTNKTVQPASGPEVKSRVSFAERSIEEKRKKECLFTFAFEEARASVGLFFIIFAVVALSGRKVLQELTAWPVYIGLFLSVISAVETSKVFLLKTKEKDNVSPFIFICHFVTILFQVVCLIFADTKWIFFLMGISVLDIVRLMFAMGRYNSLQWAVIGAVMATVFISIIGFKVPVGWYWVMVALIVIGIRWMLKFIELLRFDVHAIRKSLLGSLVFLGLSIAIEFLVRVTGLFDNIEIFEKLVYMHPICIGITLFVIELMDLVVASLITKKYK